jgi:hypothetical protein
MAMIWPTTASRKSRSCEISSSVAGVFFSQLFQPEDGVEVEVVGRFVEQQEVGAAGEGAGEVQANPPAAGEIGHRTRKVGVGEAQAVQHFGDAGLGRVAVDLAEAGVQVADRLAVAAAFGLGQFAFDTAQFDVAVEHEVERASGSAGVSWATRAICQLAGISTSPDSACSSLASSANRLDLPQPLAPTTPTFQPGCS